MEEKNKNKKVKLSLLVKFLLKKVLIPINRTPIEFCCVSNHNNT